MNILFPDLLNCDRYINTNSSLHVHCAIYISISSTSRRTVLSDGRDWTWQSDFTGLLFFVSVVLLSATILHFVLSFFVWLSYLNLTVPMRKYFWKHSCMHEFSIFYSHTKWNLLSSGTNTLLWWRACYKTTKLQVFPTALFYIPQGGIGWIMGVGLS